MNQNKILSQLKEKLIYENQNITKILDKNQEKNLLYYQPLVKKI